MSAPTRLVFPRRALNPTAFMAISLRLLRFSGLLGEWDTSPTIPSWAVEGTPVGTHRVELLPTEPGYLETRAVHDAGDISPADLSHRSGFGDDRSGGAALFARLTAGAMGLTEPDPCGLFRGVMTWVRKLLGHFPVWAAALSAMLLRAPAAFVLGAGGHALLSLWAALHESATWDETYAVAAGYLQTQRGDFRLTPENPPLLGLVVTPALRLLGAEPPQLPDGPIAARSVFGWGTRFFFDMGNRHELVLLLARLSVLLTTVLAIVSLIGLARKLMGARAGLLCAALCLAEPNWLVHGHIAAWDGVATATITLAWVALSHWLARPTTSGAVVFGVAAGAALSAKHTALALGPVSAVSLVAWVLLAPLGAAQPRQRISARLRFGLGQAATMAGVAILVIGATYNLSFAISDYLESVQSIYRLNNPRYENYLLGEFRKGPFPHYYLVALLVKTPVVALPLLLLGFAVLGRAVGRGASDDRRRLLLQLAPALSLAVVLMTAGALNPYQIGVRHVLPVIPCLILFASAGAALLPGAGAASPSSRRGPESTRWGGIDVKRRCGGGVRASVASALAAAALVETLSQAPQLLSFFNVAVGGPPRGLRYLANSNIDWGQDLVALARLQRERKLGRLSLMYSGTASPAAYGVAFSRVNTNALRRPESGRVYAVSLNFVHRLRRRADPMLAWLNAEPWAMAGHSIALFRAD